MSTQLRPLNAEEPATKPGLSYAWYVVIVLMACFALSFIDRQILSLLVGPIKAELGISDTRIGLLQGLAFALFYSAMGLPLGRIGDTWSRRTLIGLSILVWSCFTAACSFARTFASLFAARVGVGIGEAGLSPAAYSMIADYFVKEQLGVAMSVYYMGVFIGSSLALLVGGLTVDALGSMSSITLPLVGTMTPWRLTFLVVALPGVPFAALMYTIKEPLRRNLLRTAAGAASKLGIRDSFKEVQQRWKSVTGICLGMICQSACTYGFLAWMPTFFVRVHHWTPGQAGRSLGFLILTFGCAGMYAGGRLCDYWFRKGHVDAGLRVALPSAIGAGILYTCALLAPTAGWTLGLIGPALFMLALPMAPVVAALQLIFPNQLRSQISALLLLFVNVGGLSLGPLLPGLLNDRVFRSESMIGPSLAITIAAACLMMLIVFSLTCGAYRRDYRRWMGTT
jgi:MFS family permease